MMKKYYIRTLLRDTFFDTEVECDFVKIEDGAYYFYNDGGRTNETVAYYPVKNTIISTVEL